MSILNFIKNIFKTESARQKETKFKPDSNAYYFHEDYYCQIEYLPKENFSTSSKVATEIIEHSEKTFDGYGWKGCYIRSEASVPTISKNIKVRHLVDFLINEGFSEYPSVTTGYSTTVFPCDNIRAFKRQSIVLCIDFKGDIVDDIWHNDSPHQLDNDIYKEFLLTMADKFNLLLADWWKSIVVDISNPEEIDKYFVYDE
ncbi:MAG: hypothetical protein JWR61_1108 [Ferruginibacter sp.]|uniref:hypothetical protein n=1 Tax=Ferruginibacter sp. TaxID=1940288 RepID=UPI0026592EC5|nr:hypothetical protein [Ferruginibacter sp.]MDB5276153.1 hypothetical protein [Ferruginibacter sp.]